MSQDLKPGRVIGVLITLFALVAQAVDGIRNGRSATQTCYTVEGMAVLSDDQVDAALPELEGWERADGALRRSVKFPTFLDGIEAVRRVAEHAEAADHHPDIDIRWRTVTFTLVTHSEGGITDKDLAMAREIDGLLG